MLRRNMPTLVITIRQLPVNRPKCVPKESQGYAVNKHKILRTNHVFRQTIPVQGVTDILHVALQACMQLFVLLLI